MVQDRDEDAHEGRGQNRKEDRIEKEEQAATVIGDCPGARVASNDEESSERGEDSPGGLDVIFRRSEDQGKDYVAA